MTRDECIDICVTGILNFLKIVHENKLLGRQNFPEYKMTPSVNKYFNACGIADLIYKDREDKLHILDGKNASTPGKYEDPDQLRWYALCFRLQFGKLPDRVGFYYFRYPSTNPPPNLNLLMRSTNKIGQALLKYLLIYMILRDWRKKLLKHLKQSIEGFLKLTLYQSIVRCAILKQFVKKDKHRNLGMQAKRGLRRAKVDDPVDGADGFLEFSMTKKS